MTANSPIAAAFFDLDGVLVDSLGPHLEICREKAREFGLHLDIPDANGLRSLVQRGAVISPMRHFFEAVGFPAEFARRATADYEREFASRYAPQLFPGAARTLRRIHENKLPLGLVTANTRPIAAQVLGELMQCFDASCVFTDDDPSKLSKSDALKAGAASLGLPVERLLYIGDQPKDAEAASAAGTQFLGVTYGWGISRGANAFATVDDVEAIADIVLAGSGNLKTENGCK